MKIYNKKEIFERNWKEFLKDGLNNRSSERVSRYDIVQMFFEIGYARGKLE